MLAATHAVALVAAQYGHRRAVEAFEQHRLPVTVSAAAAQVQLPAVLADLDASTAAVAAQRKRADVENAAATDTAVAEQAGRPEAERQRLIGPVV